VRDLQLLPKAHLHVHLEGAMRPATLTEIAAGYGIEVPATRGYGSFATFSGLYRAAEAVLQTESDLRRVVREVLEDAAADGAIYIEPQMYPGRYTDRLGSPGDVLDLVIDEGQASAGRLGIGFGLQLSADRNSDPADAEAMAVLAAERAGRGMVSFGLAADEASCPVTVPRSGWPAAVGWTGSRHWTRPSRSRTENTYEVGSCAPPLPVRPSAPHSWAVVVDTTLRPAASPNGPSSCWSIRWRW
jgi:hypothetical protein